MTGAAMEGTQSAAQSQFEQPEIANARPTDRQKDGKLKVLLSWKEVARYTGRSVRTVQLW